MIDIEKNPNPNPLPDKEIRALDRALPVQKPLQTVVITGLKYVILIKRS
ncbi:TPA_asm: hypothetical protein HUJ06_032060 [Nelumbo nucifera]|uniref:Uncharacterized protein n=1 Tax=Nelumbo nucifera TaxID=4432 RepID=A0A822ZWW2_NELNU|nr:TPA_asm: hypothetical protein HUJ06_032060 [Nelumbo nucifera]